MEKIKKGKKGIENKKKFEGQTKKACWLKKEFN